MSSLNPHEKDLWQLQLERERYDASVASYAGIPARQDAVIEIYQRLRQAESRIAPNGDYLRGSARVDDDILVLNGLSRVLLTAEHATMHIRKSQAKEADIGTGALAEVVAQDTNSTAIVATGRQTSDANYEPDHPVKTAMAAVIKLPQNRAHFSLHMLDRGRATDPQDRRGYSVMLGIGKQPSEATLALKDYILETASDLGLRIGVNAPHINFDKNTCTIRRNEDGSLRTVTFAAAGPYTTRTYSQTLAEAMGKNDDFAAVQMEINEVLFVRHNDDVEYPNKEDRQVAAYLGYLFVRMAADSVIRL